MKIIENGLKLYKICKYTLQNNARKSVYKKFVLYLCMSYSYFELKGELNETKLKLEDYLAEISQLKKGSSECQKKNQELKDDNIDVKRKLDDYQTENSQS